MDATNRAGGTAGLLPPAFGVRRAKVLDKRSVRGWLPGAMHSARMWMRRPLRFVVKRRSPALVVSTFARPPSYPTVGMGQGLRMEDSLVLSKEPLSTTSSSSTCPISLTRSSPRSSPLEGDQRVCQVSLTQVSSSLATALTKRTAACSPNPSQSSVCCPEFASSPIRTRSLLLTRQDDRSF